MCSLSLYILEEIIYVLTTVDNILYFIVFIFFLGYIAELVKDVVKRTEEDSPKDTRSP